MAIISATPQITRDQVEAAVNLLIRWVGEDPTRDGLIDTPSRVARSFQELCDGYGADPKDILSRTFMEQYDEMIVLRDAPFYSLCEHHLLPFYGTATIGYIPNDEAEMVVGISKLARLLDCFAHRLQVQERLTQQIAKAIAETLKAKGVGVVITAEHLCMACRGVRKPGTQMVTSAMLGAMRTIPSSRSEFLGIRGRHGTAN